MKQLSLLSLGLSRSSIFVTAMAKKYVLLF